MKNFAFFQESLKDISQSIGASIQYGLPVEALPTIDSRFSILSDEDDVSDLVMSVEDGAIEGDYEGTFVRLDGSLYQLTPVSFIGTRPPRRPPINEE